MAEAAKEQEASTSEGSTKKKKPIKLIGIVAGLMIAEGAAVFVVAGAGGGAQDAHAEQVEHGATDDALRPVEIPLVEEKFQNMQTGRVWIWDIEIVLQVKGKNQEHVKGTLALREAEIKEGLAGIFRRAQHNHLKEPDLTTLNRQISRYINELIGPDHEGNPRVDRVFIPKCKGFQSEY